ncbi:MAG TPA: metal ABC transporter substrate-binding protein [Acidimicrobiales bacterium]|nr:metal ABC transporter substrate-binding protein [Acidimicrobiales bacterium]
MARTRSVAVAVLLALAITACGGASTQERTGSDGIRVATTVAPVTDIVRQVVGDRVELDGLIPEGVDSHTFEPSPSTVRSLAGADVLFLNGLHLEESTLAQARAAMRKDAPIVALGDRTLGPQDYAFDFSFPREEGDPNPHVWMDPVVVRQWSEIVRDTMAHLDPEGAGLYRANQERFTAALDKLDAGIRASVASIPPPARKLVTYHDSFAYFSRRYGIPVIAAVQPSDFSEPRPREIQALAEQVRAEKVPAVFGSEVFPSEVAGEIARESGARFVDALRDDVLPGRPGSPEHTYVGMVVHNVAVITEALGGDPAPVRSVPTLPSWSR